jgi:DNA-binding MarR family transcriptional regulator
MLIIFYWKGVAPVNIVSILITIGAVMPARTILSQMPGHLIRRLHQRSTAVFQDRMKQANHDMTSVQFAALDVLQQQPGIDQATLAQLMAYDRATIGGVVKRLEQKGLIERQIDAEDRRARALTLTDEGLAVLRAVQPLVEDLQSDILGNLSEAERATFMALTQKALGSI